MQVCFTQISLILAQSKTLASFWSSDIISGSLLLQNEAPSLSDMQGISQLYLLGESAGDSSRQRHSLSFLKRILFPALCSCCFICLEFPVFLIPF